MSSHAARYLQNESQVEQSSALAILLKLSAADTSLNDEDRAQVEAAIAKTEHSTKTLLHTYRERLKKTHLAYPEPKRTFLSAITDYEKHKASIREKCKEEIALGGDSANLARDKLMMGDGTLHEPIVEEKGAFFALNPTTGDRYEEPLAYPHEIEWEHFSKYVKRNPYTRTLDLHRTLMKFMEIGKKKGLTRQQLMELNKLLLFHEKPENYTSVSLSEDPFRVFEVILGLIDYTSHLAQLRVALKKVSRRPEECIQSVVYCYASIVNELLQVQTPDSTDKQNEDLSQKEAARAIKHFVTPEMWNEVVLFKEMYKNQNDLSSAPLSVIFDFINATENAHPNMRPKVTMNMAHNIQVDLFLTEQSRHHSWQLGDPNPGACDGDDGDDEDDQDDDETEQEALMTEAGAAYENWPPGSGHSTLGLTEPSTYGGGYPSGGAPAMGAYSAAMASVAKPPQMKGTHAMTTRSSGANATYGPGDLPGRKKGGKKGKSQISTSLSQTRRPGSPVVKPTPATADTSVWSHHSSAGRTGRPLQKSGQRGVSPVSPSRVTQYSPNTGRKRYYTTSPGGRVYPVPRSKLFTVDKDNQLKPRSRTPSKDRSSNQKDKRCPRCDRKYEKDVTHICDYGKVKADTVCHKCKRGKHPPSVCLGVTPSRSPSRDSSKGGDKMLPQGFNKSLN